VVELMFVVVIIGILTAIALPRFMQTLVRAHEGAVRGNLGSLRSSLKVYYADTEGGYPDTLEFLTQGGKYAAAIPNIQLRDHHADSTAVREGAGMTASNDRNGWLYISVATSTDFGSLYVNCTHTDLSGTVWTSY
jgi:type II secretory pathway pseudopilin PulG